VSAAALLERLRRVTTTGAGRWLARCPAHADKSPSLSIREPEPGLVLVHCFAGCAVGDVVAAVGLDLSDLFPPRPLGHAVPGMPVPIPAGDALRAVAAEAALVAMVAGRVAAGETIDVQTAERVAVAAGRLFAAVDLALPDPKATRDRRAAMRASASVLAELRDAARIGAALPA
jgi:hypothetical protein